MLKNQIVLIIKFKRKTTKKKIFFFCCYKILRLKSAVHCGSKLSTFLEVSDDVCRNNKSHNYFFFLFYTSRDFQMHQYISEGHKTVNGSWSRILHVSVPKGTRDLY